MRIADILHVGRGAPERAFTPSSLTAFLLSGLLTLAFVCVFQAPAYFFDSNHYWELARSFWNIESSMFSNSIAPHGVFALDNFPRSPRGYLFPLLLGAMSHFAVLIGLPEALGLRLLAAFSLGLTGAFALPYLFSAYSEKAVSVAQRLFPVGLVLVFWRGLFIYPLSDFYACSMLVSASALILFMSRRRSSSFSTLASSFLVGALLYGSYNTRPVYLFACIAALAIMAVLFFTIERKTLSVWMMFILLGFLSIAAPQMLVNKNNMGSYSCMLPDDRSLFRFQLYEGLRIQNFIGVVDERYPKYNAVYFADPVGQRIIAAEIEDDAVKVKKNFANYFKLIGKYPFDVAGIYLRHLAGYLNPVFGEVYIRDLYKWKIGYTLANYVFMCAAFFSLLFAWKERRDDSGSGWSRLAHLKGLLVFVPPLVPCLVLMMGAPEQRFFFPVYLLLYGMLAYGIQYERLRRGLARSAQLAVPMAVLVFFVLASMWSMEFALAFPVLPRPLSLW